MIESLTTIVNEIESYMSRMGGLWRDWYVGIAADAEDALFSRHNVSRTSGSWIWRPCLSSESARQIEQYFLDKGCDGGPGGGDGATRFVYAYKKTSYTNQ